jgi:hypothetical protein
MIIFAWAGGKSRKLAYFSLCFSRDLEKMARDVRKYKVIYRSYVTAYIGGV